MQYDHIVFTDIVMIVIFGSHRQEPVMQRLLEMPKHLGIGQHCHDIVEPLPDRKHERQGKEQFGKSTYRTQFTSGSQAFIDLLKQIKKI
ncbi:MAG: hypothetical protein WDN69_23490 [Aliidongia sp.]